MVYAFIVGPIAITVHHCEVNGPRDELEVGARIEVRRTVPVRGRRDRPGAAGWRIEPVSDGGIWRSDLLELVSGAGRESRHHHHPEFRDDDVGRRVFDPALTADPVGWTMAQLADLPNLLTICGADDLIDSTDPTAVRRILPAVRTAIEDCLGQGSNGVAVD